MGARHRLEPGENLGGGGPVATGEPRQHHRVAAGEQIPGVEHDRFRHAAPEARPAAPHRRPRASCRTMASSARPDASSARASAATTGFQPPPFVVARQQDLGRGSQRLVRFSGKHVPQTCRDRMNQRHGVFGGKVVELRAQAAEPVPAAASRQGQAPSPPRRPGRSSSPTSAVSVGSPRSARPESCCSSARRSSRATSPSRSSSRALRSRR